MSKLLSGWLICLAPTVTHAQEWVPLADANNVFYEGRAGSIEYSVTEVTSEPIVTFMLRVRDARQTPPLIKFEKNYIRLSDCQAGYGKIVTTDLNGRALYSNDFVLKGGSIAAALADVACGVANSQRGENVRPAGRF
jgi:hypothetical protein